MKGPTHALSGLAAGAATLPWAATYLGVHDLPIKLAWTACWGGMAMLSDLDKRGTTAAQMWGPITQTTARGIGWIARGHRKGTHDVVIAPIVFAVIASIAAQYRAASLIVLAVAIGLALHACHFVIPGNVERTRTGNLVLSVAGAYYVVQASTDTTWLPFAVAGGVIAHIAGDALTTDGVPVPVLWMFGGKRTWGIPLADTGTWIEPVAATACAIVTAWQLAANTGHWPALMHAIHTMTA